MKITAKPHHRNPLRPSPYAVSSSFCLVSTLLPISLTTFCFFPVFCFLLGTFPYNVTNLLATMALELVEMQCF